MRNHVLLPLICGLVIGGAAWAQIPDETPLGEGVERHLSSDEPVNQWVHDPTVYQREAGDRFETREVVGEALETVKLTNVIPPIRFESGVADIPQDYIDLLRFERVREDPGFRHVAPQTSTVDGPHAAPAAGTPRHDRWIINKVRALCSWYTKGFTNGSTLRTEVNAAQSLTELRDLISRFFMVSG